MDRQQVRSEYTASGSIQACGSYAVHFSQAQQHSPWLLVVMYDQ